MPYRRPFFALAASRLEEEAIDLVVISADEPGPDSEAPTAENSPLYVRLGSLFRRSVTGKDIVEDLVVPRGLMRALRRLDPQLVVTEDLSALPANLQVPLFAALKRRRYLIWTLGPVILGKRRSTYRTLAAPMIAALRRPAWGFICYSRWAAREMERAYGKPCFVAPNSTVSRPPPIDLEKLPKSGEARIRVIFIGRLSAQKRLEVLLEAVPLSEARVEVDIVGEGEERQRLESLAVQLQIGDQVRFHGDIRDAATKARLIDQAHVAVMPGLGGLFVQEVQARGCPVIATAADGTEQDLVRAVNPDLYLERGEAREIAARLSSLAAQPERLLRARAAAFDVVRESYNLEAMVEGWVQGALSALRGTKR